MGNQMKSLILLLLISSAALADDAELLRCRTIADATSRLACYDALVLPVSGSAAGTSSAGRGTIQTPPGTSASAAQPKTDQFGLEEKLANKDAVDAIESHIPGSFEGWTARSNIKLANGQVWQISDNSARAHYIDNPKVRIRRGALGSFYLEIQGTNISPRVKRVQ